MQFLQIKKFSRLLVFLCISFLYFLNPNARPDFTKFNAHDSESYIALSQNLHSGLGYTRNMDPDNFIPHTLWPPGMPILLMPAVIVSGETISWLAVKYTMIIVALLGLWLSWKYIYRLSGNKRLADLLTFFIALNPFYWHFSRIAMAEVPSYVWIVGSLLLIDIVWKNKDVKLSVALVVGAVIGLGMMIKGVVIGLAVAPIVYMLEFNDVKKVKRNILVLFVYGLGFSIAFISWGVRNHHIDKENLGFDGVNQVQMLFKQVPEDPNSPYRNTSQLIQTAKENVAWHGIYHFSSQIVPNIWKLDLKSTSQGAIIALLICLILLVGLLPRTLLVMPLYCTILPMILMMLLITIGGSERYWGPISLLCLLGIGIQFSAWFQRNIPNLKPVPAAYFTVFIIVIALQLLSLIQYVNEHESQPYTLIENRDDLARLFEKNRNFCIGNNQAEVLAVYTKNEHAFHLITGCNAPMLLLERGIDPIFSHAVVDMEKLTIKLPEKELISIEGEWAFIRLDTLMTVQGIHRFYYN